MAFSSKRLYAPYIKELLADQQMLAQDIETLDKNLSILNKQYIEAKKGYERVLGDNLPNKDKQARLHSIVVLQNDLKKKIADGIEDRKAYYEEYTEIKNDRKVATALSSDAIVATESKVINLKRSFVKSLEITNLNKALETQMSVLQPFFLSRIRYNLTRKVSLIKIKTPVLEEEMAKFHTLQNRLKELQKPAIVLSRKSRPSRAGHFSSTQKAQALPTFEATASSSSARDAYIPLATTTDSVPNFRK